VNGIFSCYNASVRHASHSLSPTRWTIRRIYCAVYVVVIAYLPISGGASVGRLGFISHRICRWQPSGNYDGGENLRNWYSARSWEAAFGGVDLKNTGTRTIWAGLKYALESCLPVRAFECAHLDGGVLILKLVIARWAPLEKVLHGTKVYISHQVRRTPRNRGQIWTASKHVDFIALVSPRKKNRPHRLKQLTIFS